MSLLILLASCIFIVEQLALIDSQPVKPPNVIKATSGYNFVKGNPFSDPDDRGDPGFQENHHLFKLEYTKNAVSGDERYIAPDYIDIESEPVCSFDNIVKDIYSSYDYQKLLGFEANLGVALGSQFAFSGSTDYQELETVTTTRRQTYVFLQIKCASYKAKISAFSNISLSDEFVEAVNQLPTTGDDRSKYFQLFDQFGTHYAASTTMGSRVISISTIDQTDMAELQQCGLKVGVLAEVMLPGYQVDAEILSSKQKTLKTYFAERHKSTKQIYQGNLPNNRSLPFDIWSRVARDDPFPISYQLLPLTYLLKVNLFRSMSQCDLANKSKMMDDSLAAYCTYLGSECSIPKVTPLPTNPGSTKDCSILSNGEKTASVHIISLFTSGVIACICKWLPTVSMSYHLT